MYGRGELFEGRPIHDFQQSHKEQLIREIRAYDANAILRTSIDELISYFEEKYIVGELKINSEEKYLPEEPREESTTERVLDRVWNEHVNVNKHYINFSVHVPFEGDPALFNLQPSSRTYFPDRTLTASIKGKEIIFQYHIEASGNPDLLSQANREIGVIETNARNLNADIGRLNAEIPAIIKEQLSKRKERRILYFFSK